MIAVLSRRQSFLGHRSCKRKRKVSRRTIFNTRTGRHAVHHVIVVVLIFASVFTFCVRCAGSIYLFLSVGVALPIGLLLFPMLSSHVPSVCQTFLFGSALVLYLLELRGLVRCDTVGFDLFIVFGGSGCVLVLQVDGVCAHHIGPAASHGEVGLASLGFGQVGRRWPGLGWRQGAMEWLDLKTGW